jgi:hypothetical protein
MRAKPRPALSCRISLKTEILLAVIALENRPKSPPVRARSPGTPATRHAIPKVIHAVLAISLAAANTLSGGRLRRSIDSFLTHGTKSKLSSEPLSRQDTHGCARSQRNFILHPCNMIQGHAGNFVHKGLHFFGVSENWEAISCFHATLAKILLVFYPHIALQWPSTVCRSRSVIDSLYHFDTDWLPVFQKATDVAARSAYKLRHRRK